METNREDLLLLAIKHSGSGGLTPEQLQKVLFIFGMRKAKLAGTRFYQFVSCNNGPFSKEISSDAEFLEACGLANRAKRVGRTYETYSITPNGLARANTVEKKIAPEAKEFVMKLVSDCTIFRF